MCEYMWQICWCSSSLMLSSFAQDSDLSIRLPKIVIPEPRCLQGHNSVSLSDHFLPWSSTGGGALGTSCLGSWQILPPNFLVQGSQVRWQSGICTRSFLPWGQSTMWSSRRQWTQEEKIALVYHCLICNPINIWITKWITFICQEKGCGFLIISSNISHS